MTYTLFLLNVASCYSEKLITRVFILINQKYKRFKICVYVQMRIGANVHYKNARFSGRFRKAKTLSPEYSKYLISQIVVLLCNLQMFRRKMEQRTILNMLNLNYFLFLFTSELKIKWDFEDNSEILFSYLSLHVSHMP